MKTAMQELKSDLLLAIHTCYESLKEIKDLRTKEACQEVVLMTINNILNRIDNELLEMEKEQIINAFKNGDCNGTFETINGKQYYNETFKSE